MGELMATPLRGETPIAQLSPKPRTAERTNGSFELLRLSHLVARLRENSKRNPKTAWVTFERHRLRMSKGKTRRNARFKFNYAAAAPAPRYELKMQSACFPRRKLYEHSLLSRILGKCHWRLRPARLSV